jgi:hypothetical protein
MCLFISLINSALNHDLTSLIFFVLLRNAKIQLLHLFGHGLQPCIFGILHNLTDLCFQFWRHLLVFFYVLILVVSLLYIFICLLLNHISSIFDMLIFSSIAITPWFVSICFDPAIFEPLFGLLPASYITISPLLALKIPTLRLVSLRQLEDDFFVIL